jgi:hypothetical protein
MLVAAGAGTVLLALAAVAFSPQIFHPRPRAVAVMLTALLVLALVLVFGGYAAFRFAYAMDGGDDRAIVFIAVGFLTVLGVVALNIHRLSLKAGLRTSAIQFLIAVAVFATPIALVIGWAYLGIAISE